MDLLCFVFVPVKDLVHFFELIPPFSIKNWCVALWRKIPEFVYLVDAFDDGTHGGIAGPVHRLPVVGRTPTGAVDVDEIGFVAHAVGLDQVCHVGLIQHANACHHHQKTQSVNTRNSHTQEEFFKLQCPCMRSAAPAPEMVNLRGRGPSTGRCTISVARNLTWYGPATFESYATPTPQTPLSRAADTSPAHRVPWLKQSRHKKM